MTTPVKTYQNISFQELIAFSEQNPHRSVPLKMQEVKPQGVFLNSIQPSACFESSVFYKKPHSCFVSLGV